MTTPDPSLRDFLMVSAFSGLGVAGAAAAWGLGPTMAPDAAVRAGVEQVVFKLAGKPWAVRHRTKEEIESAREVAFTELIDPLARNATLDPQSPATDENRSATADGRFIVLSLICTHLGCVVTGDRSGEFDGWFCPCHASHFDPAGRVRRGPAPRNLPIPYFKVTSDMVMTFSVAKPVGPLMSIS